MTPAQKSQIQADAERAAQERQTPNERCPHPFSSEQGKLWVQAYWEERNKSDRLWLRGDFEADHEDRRGK